MPGRFSERPPEPDPVERLIELALFAPVGLAVSMGDWVAALAERGRNHVEGRIPAARIVGEMAVREGRRRAEKALGPLLHQAEEAASEWTRRARGESASARPTTPGSGAGASATSRATGGSSRHRNGDGDAGSSAASRPVSGGGRGAGGTGQAGVPSALQLPIPGYDTLSASQVVQRLEGLSAAELDAVSAYEQAGRARKTILTRVSQLRSAL